MLIALCFGMTLSPSLASAQILDSTGQLNTGVIGYGDAVYSSTWERISGKPETAMRWPTWEEVTGKPASASRWPSWNEVTGKPSTFPPTAHNHDDRYVRKGASGAISGNLSVSGTVTGNRLVTGDVGGERWCRANSSGRILCKNDLPTKDIFDASRIKIVHKEVCLDNHGVNYVWARCPSGTRVISCSGGPGDTREDAEGYFIRVDPKENGCELMIGKPVCNSGRPWTFQNVFATCIR